VGVVAQGQDRHRSIIRTIVVISLGLYLIATSAPQIVYYWIPLGDFGTSISARIVGDVEPHSAAADAGIRVGDRIETQYLSVHERLIDGLGSVPQAGETATLRVLHNGRERSVMLVARPTHMNEHLFWSLWDLVGLLIRVALGATLVLLRPGLLTWVFYIYLLAIGVTSSDYFTSLPAPIFIAIMLPIVLLDAARNAVLLLFALLFPTNELGSWRRRVLPIIFVAFGSGVFVNFYEVAGLISNYDTTPLDPYYHIFDTVVAALALAIVLVRYFESKAFERERIKWVIFAFAISYSILVVLRLSGIAHRPQELLLNFHSYFVTGLFLPIAVAYAIIRYRVFDLQFVLSRTLVYSLLLAAAIGIFVAIDFIFTSRFHGSRGELAVDIAVALGLGFWVRAIQGRAIDLVDRLLFWRRYDSRMRLRAAVDSLADAESPCAIEEIVTARAATSLGLASAVFFRRVADGGLLREVGFGWPADAPWHLLPDDRLVAQLDRHASSIDLNGIGWSRSGASPPQEPVLAVPMQLGANVVGVTLYGDRLNGGLPSPDEVRGLIELAQRAASAYLLFDSARRGVSTRELAAARISR
jgi:hypothetical protein